MLLQPRGLLVMEIMGLSQSKREALFRAARHDDAALAYLTGQLHGFSDRWDHFDAFPHCHEATSRVSRYAVLPVPDSYFP